ncbi:nitroreductase/quinone reductase family protein [Nocardia sp. NBC_01329]|uniref:nitroreductase/quinone reductase family protein n=1 Tax=Nocardia sp. NBC_01329 TaxID=2903594 RepID=UPI002E111806|nr:nitroreductase family deazaflavin-dependent oxidoreductase [Nocardia sp. NBC_01329]
MTDMRRMKHRIVTTFQRHVANPLNRKRSAQQLLETTGRVSGVPRVVPVGGRRIGNEFWFVSEFGDRSDYVRNIRADGRVRVRLRGEWYSGTAYLLPDDDAVRRLASLPRGNSAAVRMMGTDLLTIRVDLDD